VRHARRSGASRLAERAAAHLGRADLLYFESVKFSWRDTPGLVVNTINTDEYHIGPGIHEYEYIQLTGFMIMNTYGAWYS
jgi:hypothetical protein